MLKIFNYLGCQMVEVLWLPTLKVIIGNVNVFVCVGKGFWQSK